MPEGNQCQNCAHYYGALRCEAYPATRIPMPFLTGEAEHSSELPNQVAGFIFEPVPANGRQPLKLTTI